MLLTSLAVSARPRDSCWMLEYRSSSSGSKSLSFSGARLVAVQDLRLGLDLELAQLVPQTDDRLVELFQVELDLGKLLGKPGIGNADLASTVQQLLQQAGVHAGKVPGFGGPLAQHAGRRLRLGLRQGGQRRLGRRRRRECRAPVRQDAPARAELTAPAAAPLRLRLEPGADQPPARAPDSKLEHRRWFRLRLQLQHRFGLGLRQGGRERFVQHGSRARIPARCRHVAAQGSGQARQQPWRRRRSDTGRNLVAEDVQFIERRLDKAVGPGTSRQQAIGHAQQQRLQVVAQVTHREQARHPGAALQGVQPALEVREGLLFVLAGGQSGHGLVADLEYFAGLLGKDGCNFRVPARCGRAGGNLGSSAGRRSARSASAVRRGSAPAQRRPSRSISRLENLGQIHAGSGWLTVQLTHRDGGRPRRRFRQLVRSQRQAPARAAPGPAWTPCRCRRTLPTRPPPVRRPGQAGPADAR